ncbi:hypothetical protein CONLIGDRAFT_678467 [Coniochaeta ligniaria NRRL 30616]|uniref:Biotrophy-associated secreted protein 2 n=1 Tax=Coniochaeta ligniaria NRRL 30616 TaxID=1408157 RepID=A0A1J7IXX9_9PEZI|nr:hypothetical protein CONLIGDRAFT_678467 [Coniochaeta ligniaria NRRL 30616]
MVRITLAAVLAFAVTSLALVQPNNAGARSVGNGQGEQFITGGCVNDADCGSACCANNSQGLGVCSAEAAALQNDKQGCGFVDPKSAATIAAAKAQVAKQGF